MLARILFILMEQFLAQFVAIVIATVVKPILL